MMEKLCCKPWMKNKSLGLLILRLALGVVFIAHGWQKFQSMEMVVGFFGTLGLAPFFAYLVAGIEVLGGIAMLLGVGAAFAGWLLAAVMLFAIVLVNFKKGLIGGYSYDLVLLAASLAIAFSGSGKYSVCPGCKNCCAGGSCAGGVCMPADGEMKQ